MAKFRKIAVEPSVNTVLRPPGVDVVESPPGMDVVQRPFKVIVATSSAAEVPFKVVLTA